MVHINIDYECETIFFMNRKLVMKHTKLKLAILFTFMFATCLIANDKIKVVTSTPDLADIAEQIGGDKIEVIPIARGFQDPHFVDPKPSHILKLKKADIFIQIGLDLEIGWVPPLLEKARNRKIFYNGLGYLNASKDIHLLEVPNINPAELRAQGDIHIYGNPHYWLNPDNGKIIAKNIYDKLSLSWPEESDYFYANFNKYSSELDSAIFAWTKIIEPYQNQKIIAYHNSWPYFADKFKINVAGFIEPKPGIPPTPKHLLSVIELMKNENIKVIIISPYFDQKPARTIADKTGAEVIAIAPSVGAVNNVKTYLDLFEYNLNALASAFERSY